MSLSFTPIERYITKFYQRESDSKNFLELSEEQLSILAKNVYRRLESISTLSEKADKKSKLELYQNTLQYLTTPPVYLTLRTFDERIAYLIMMTDPNLVTFKEFLKADLISLSDIDKTESQKEKNVLRKTRQQAISAYKSIVREKIGFFDVKLLKYEELFFKRFFNEKELVTEVGSNNQDSLMTKAKFLKDFNSISDDRYEELVSVAQTWLSLIPDKYNSKVATYSVTKQKKLLGLTNLTEQLTLFILLVDSNLDMLKIYEEECTFENIEERIVNNFGYFNKDLIALERKFHDRFCPDKELSVWSKIKKS